MSVDGKGSRPLGVTEGIAPGKAGCGLAAPAKNSLAMRARSAGSGTLAGTCNVPPNILAQLSSVIGAAASNSLVLMVISYIDAFEHGDRVVNKHRRRTVQRNQIGRQGLVVDAHEADGKPGAHFSGKTRLEQSDASLFPLANTEQQDLRFVVRILDMNLVRGNQRN